MHLVGIDTQEIFETLQDTGHTYDEAITNLNEYFDVKKDILYEQSVFREAKQETDESLDQFITRLRNLQHIVNMEIMLMMKLEIKSYTQVKRQNY